MKTKQSMSGSDISAHLRETDKNEYVPFLLEPALKKYLWGGTRLSKEYAKGNFGERIAESWECSTHANGESVVKNGMHAGKTLKKVLMEYPDMLGKRQQGVCPPGELPVLVKLLDAGQNASIQVHPDDQYARVHEDGALGKTEMWYVLDATEDAELVYGFHHDMSRDKVEAGLADGSLEKYLQKIKVQKDDVFFIPPGCVHSVGAGILLVEIQENSDLTYRMYDYNRVDCDGQKRELHVEKALDVLNLKGSAKPRQPMRVLRYEPGCATEFLCRCRYFQVERKLIARAEKEKGIGFEPEQDSYQIILCTQGEGILRGREDYLMPLQTGDCVFVPAGAGGFEIVGRLTILQIKC